MDLKAAIDSLPSSYEETLSLLRKEGIVGTPRNPSNCLFAKLLTEMVGKSVSVGVAYNGRHCCWVDGTEPIEELSAITSEVVRNFDAGKLSEFEG